MKSYLHEKLVAPVVAQLIQKGLHHRSDAPAYFNTRNVEQVLHSCTSVDTLHVVASRAKKIVVPVIFEPNHHLPIFVPYGVCASLTYHSI